MAQKKDTTSILGLALIFLCLLIHSEIAESTDFIVGDDSGWTFHVDNWPSGKSFKEGDVLVFSYDPTLHNIAAVDSTIYDNCDTDAPGPVFQSGNDRITLSKGFNYFICSFPGHCQAGMKLAVFAAKSKS